jgi:hypothetical protein
MPHTPGPWLYDHQDNQALITDTQGFTVIELHALENSTAHSALADNARLIAAAPELLDALKGILYHFVPMQGTLKVEDDMIKQAHAAINKATGE